MDINENILTNIINKIRDDYKDKNVNLKILNVFYDKSLEIYKLEEEYKNARILNLKIDSIDTKDIKEYSYEEFDYILIFDTLEKLISPDIFLKNMKKYMKNDGNLICSIPNIMHKSVLKDLLVGKFTYSDSGILNKNNIRFFTLEEMMKLFNNEGYSLKPTLAVLIDSTKEDEQFVDNLCKITNDNLRLNFNSYSYLITATKKITKTLYDYVLNP